MVSGASGLRWPSVAVLGVLAAACGTPAFAAADEASRHHDAAAVGEDVAAVEEVIVTARRREERAQDVPIALSVISADSLQKTGVYTLSQAQQLAPTLQVFSFNPRNTNINLRGLGSNVAVTSDGLDNGVGVYVDQVYQGRVALSQFDLVDLQKIEVLRGPQGTLFGKNTTAGAINITTRAPTVEPGFDGEASVGDHGYHQVRASVTGGLATGVAARLSVAQTSRGGLIDNVTTGKKIADYTNFTIRGQLAFNPTSSLSIRLIGDYARQSQHCCVSVLVGQFSNYDNGAAIPNSVAQRFARLGYTPVYDPFARRTDVNAPVEIQMRQHGLSGQVDWQTPIGTFTSVTAYRHWGWDPHNDIDNTALSVFDDARTISRQRQFSQELRLASPGEGRVDYVVGAYYFRQRVASNTLTQYGVDAPLWNLPPATVPTTISIPALAGFGTINDSVARTTSLAAFGQLTWRVTDRLSLTGGLRYTHEKKTGDFAQVQYGPSLAGLAPAGAAAAQGLRNSFGRASAFTAETTDNSVSGLANLSYKITPDVLVYLTYSRGSKSGGLNLTTLPPGVGPAVEPERVDSYEAGLKSEFFDRSLQVNLAAYWTEVRDYQTVIAEVSSTAGLVTYVANIGKVRSRGFEVDAVWRPFDGVELSGSGAYNDATYVSYRNGTCPPEKQHLGKVCDLSGQPLAGAPKWAGTASLDLSRPFGAVEGYARVDYSYRSGFFTAINNSRYARVDSYGLTNLRLGVRKADRGWDVSVWARNIFDVNYFQTRGASDAGLVTGILGEPRTFGATVRANF